MLSKALGDGVHLEDEPAALSARVDDMALATRALAELAGAGIALADFSLGQPSLDVVFLTLTGHAAETAVSAEAVPGRESK